MTPPGQAFEGEVHKWLRRVLVPELLGMDPGNTRVYRGKSYYSRDRSSTIKTDVSVEIFLKGASEPSILWIWECKDYSHPVPVDDIEEFESKLRQIGEHNTKGTMVARNGFQKSAVSLAKSKRIGLARQLSEDQICMIYYFGGPVRGHKAVEIMTMDNSQKCDFRFGGLDLDGHLNAHEHFAVYLAEQFFALLPHRGGPCEWCGRKTGRTFRVLCGRFDLQPRKESDAEGKSCFELSTSDFDGSIAFPFWKSFSLCWLCGSLIKLLGRLGGLVVSPNIAMSIVAVVLILALIAGRYLRPIEVVSGCGVAIGLLVSLRPTARRLLKIRWLEGGAQSTTRLTDEEVAIRLLCSDVEIRSRYRGRYVASYVVPCFDGKRLIRVQEGQDALRNVQ
jgi:hypothetical protein